MLAKEMWLGVCQSWVRMTWSKRAARALMPGRMASPSATAKAPPGRKSSCMSMTRSASVGRSCIGISVLFCAKARADVKARLRAVHLKGMRRMNRTKGGAESW